jgi:hypothetical protein
MAVSFRAVGAYVNGTGALTPVIPAGTVAGDLMLCVHGMKPFSATTTMNNGWISIGSATDGTVTAGNDVGSMKAQIFYKVHTGTETNPTVTNTATNVNGAVILSFQNATGFWEFVGSGGGDATAGTGYSITTQSALAIAPGDFLIGNIALRSDASTIGAITITGAGLTISATTNAPTTNLTTISGGDMAMAVAYANVTAGTATTTLTLSSTLSGSQTGSSFIARIREVEAPVGGYNDPFGMMGFFGI